MKDREQVIQELENIIEQLFDKESDEFYSHKVADWHLAEVARILEPLRKAEVNIKKQRPQHWREHKIRREAIEKVLSAHPEI